MLFFFSVEEMKIGDILHEALKLVPYLPEIETQVLQQDCVVVQPSITRWTMYVMFTCL